MDVSQRTKRQLSPQDSSSPSRPSKRQRSQNSRAHAGGTLGVGEFLHSTWNWITGLMPHRNVRTDVELNAGGRRRSRGSRRFPNGTNSSTAIFPGSPIAVLSDGEDEGRDAAENRLRAERTLEARQHLDDLADTQARSSPSVSASSSGSETVDSHGSVPAAPVEPLPSPSLSYKREQRQYSWDRKGSSSAKSGSSGSSSGAAHRSSRARQRAPNRGPKVFLDQLLKESENTGNPSREALQRVWSDYAQDAERDKAARRRRDVDMGTLWKSDVDLSASMKLLDLDHRQDMDEAISVSTRIRPFRLPHVPRVKIPQEAPAAAQSRILEDLREEDRAKERRIKQRLQPQIPKKLTDEQDVIVDARLTERNFKATLGAAEVNAESLRRLKPNHWLNDELIGFYVELINTRAVEHKLPVRSMNSYFYQKLSEDGYEKANLKRWTKRMKIDIFALDKLLVPINLGNMHWTCAVINFAERRIEYYDSLSDAGGNRYEVFAHLRRYLEKEHKEKKGAPFDNSGWADVYSPKTPRQDNGSDCGVFACQTMEAAARGRDLAASGFEFGAANMPFFRRLMIMEIASGKLATRSWIQT